MHVHFEKVDIGIDAQVSALAGRLADGCPSVHPSHVSGITHSSGYLCCLGPNTNLLNLEKVAFPCPFSIRKQLEILTAYVKRKLNLHISF